MCGGRAFGLDGGTSRRERPGVAVAVRITVVVCLLAFEAVSAAWQRHSHQPHHATDHPKAVDGRGNVVNRFEKAQYVPLPSLAQVVRKILPPFARGAGLGGWWAGWTSASKILRVAIISPRKVVERRKVVKP